MLADSLYGESGELVCALHLLGLQYGVAIRSNHSVEPRGLDVSWPTLLRRTRWAPGRPCERVFTAGCSEQRYIREMVCGQRRTTRYCEITTDPVHLLRDTTWLVMTNLPGKIERTAGNTVGLRTQDPRMASNTPKTHWSGPITG